MKILAVGVMALSLLGCSSSDETISREEAINQIQSDLPVNRDEAGNLIDFICGQFREGWGGAIIDRDLEFPYDQRETLSHVILLSARSECPENVVDAKAWQRYNGWD